MHPSLRYVRRINETSFDKVELPRHLSIVVVVFDISDRRSDNGNETGAFNFFLSCVFGILNTRLTCCENYQIPHTSISKYLLNGHKAQQTIIQTIF